MRKKKTKSKVRQKKRKRVKLLSKKMSKEVLSLMEKVKGKLSDLKKPVVWKRDLQVVQPTVEEYKRMDPYWQSTMTGKFAGRVVGIRKSSFKVDFPKTFCILEKVKEDLKSWVGKRSDDERCARRAKADHRVGR